MNIAIFTDSCLPYCSGVTYAVLSQVNELCRRGHSVDVFRPRPGRKFRDQVVELPNRARMIDVPFTLPAPRLPELRLVIPTLHTTLRYLHEHRPDVIHVHTEWGCGWEGLLAAKRLDVPVVGTFHTFFAEPGYLKSLRLPTWSWIQQAVWAYAVNFFNRCDVVTSPSEAVRQSLMDHGVNKEPILLSNGIDLPAPASEREIKRLRHRYGLDGPTFIYVGRVAPEKSLDVLVRAFQKVQQRLPSAKLIIIGDGPSMPSLNALVAETGMDKSVIRLGFIPHDELLAESLLKLGDIFVTASKTENQPISVLEAMAAGLTVIGPNAQGLKEMIRPGENGYHFAPDDTEGLAAAMLKFAVLSGDTKQSMSESSREFARQNSLGASIDQLESIYQSLTGSQIKQDRRSLTAA